MGQYHLAEGEAAVIRPSGTDFTEVARLTLARWRELATAPASR